MKITDRDISTAKTTALRDILAQMKNSEAKRLKAGIPSRTPVEPEIETETPMYNMSTMYIEALHDMFEVKPSVLAATTEPIKLEGSQTVDGVKVRPGHRVLVKNQDKATENGIYIVSDQRWARSLDMNEDRHISGTVFTFVERGNVNRERGFTAASPSSAVLGKTPLRFTVYKERKGKAILPSIVPNEGRTDASTLYGVGDAGTYSGTYGGNQ